MPTVLLLDVSLSMSQPVQLHEGPDDYQRRHLAAHGINAMLDYLANHNKLEFVSLVVFSSLWEQLVGFTRDYDNVRAVLANVEEYNKTCIQTGLAGATSLLTTEWGVRTPSQIVLITDGNIGVGKGSLKQTLASLNKDGTSSDDKCPLPFSFPCKLNVVCVSDPNDPTIQAALPLYQKLIDAASHGGQIFLMESPLTLKSVYQSFTKVCKAILTPYSGTLKCGNLKCHVYVFPAPEIQRDEEEDENLEFDKELQICGFLNISDISSPAYISRHLVLPSAPSVSEQEGSSNIKTESAEEGEDVGGEEGKMAAFTVLLHGALKVESMVAITQLAEDWYGILYSWADNKKKSNLMLSVFLPGTSAVPWLGKFSNLAPLTDFAEPPFGEDDNKSPFPVKPSDRRSYAQNCVVWIKSTGLQADIQKVLRNARKLPEKMQQFYKELNRVRRAAISFGFLELLDAISQLLERECTMLPGNAHPDAALQLTHAANVLQTDGAHVFTQNIIPLRTNFSSGD